MFGLSSFSELPFSIQENDAATVLTGQSVDAETGTLAITYNWVIKTIETAKSEDGMDPRVWNIKSLLDFILPSIACVAVAIAVK